MAESWARPAAKDRDDATGMANSRVAADNERASSQQLLLEYARTRDLRLRNRLVALHERLVRHLVNRFIPCRGNTADDLLQVGYLGLIAALERFDPAAGVRFATFATPTIVGVIKHHLRDQGWLLKAPRHLRDLAISLPALRSRLEHTLGRVPTIPEMAAAAGVDEERLLSAMDLSLVGDPGSLDAPFPGPEGEAGARGDAVGAEDPALAAIEAREALGAALARLDARQQAILRSRFYGQDSQAAVARRLGISQMQVSRLERQALSRLRRMLE